MQNSKRLTIFLSILGLALVGLTSFYIQEWYLASRPTLTPTPRSSVSATPQERIIFKNSTDILKVDQKVTIGWTIHRDKSGYEIKFPSKWQGMDTSEGTPRWLSSYQITPKCIPYGPCDLVQIIADEGSLENEIEGMQSDGRSSAVISNVTINGLSGKKIVYDFFDNGRFLYLFEKNGKLFRLDIAPNEQYEISWNDLLNVLATFKLI